ncbi:MAG: signal peptidase I [Chloroflexi bacterium]|nr:MAG: signal peptidase I [Chloroflexota bacterium]RLC80783.1 MAG: signal peptidase I [Chloroflexota bacterium]
MQTPQFDSGGKTLEEFQPDEEQSTLSRPAEDKDISLARTFGGRSLLREILETALLTAILFLILNTTTARFQVRGSSMEPTLHNEQYLVISKVTYWVHPPERGDIIVFQPPNNPDEDYIKRVVGLPGEQVEIRDGAIWVDGDFLEETYIANSTPYSGAWSLGEKEFFVLGDNRGNSSDSHSWGLLPQKNIIGKAWLCYWPPEDWGIVTHHNFSKSAEQ